ncbi:BlaI/MecI/CopY family transcriptional regulator [Marinicauda algicola]|uniref:BlaI/MecI/CopY family transcriptional regulator n=1 Tax=Marinicauda algicola TaxID=2029849 RepID=A0A4S2GZG1_9PROT|nr:BlaI/MecI/CopY family transcriptional regulator [Marinicauda algicola]TGY88212.1 BlaI/MecI/CopY family transcriptional regulator [Marinicauda algicola]
MARGELQLGDLEIATLEEVWRAGDGDARSIHAKIGAGRGNTLQTIQSTLERLHRKGLLARERVGHAYVYTPIESRDAVMARLIEGSLNRFSDGRGDGLLAAFAGYASKADPQMLDALEALIREHKRRDGEGSA